MRKLCRKCRYFLPRLRAVSSTASAPPLTASRPISKASGKLSAVWGMRAGAGVGAAVAAGAGEVVGFGVRPGVVVLVILFLVVKGVAVTVVLPACVVGFVILAVIVNVVAVAICRDHRHPL